MKKSDKKECPLCNAEKTTVELRNNGKTYRIKCQMCNGTGKAPDPIPPIKNILSTALSACCKSSVKIEVQEGTHYYVCRKCKEACDLMNPYDGKNLSLNGAAGESRKIASPLEIPSNLRGRFTLHNILCIEANVMDCIEAERIEKIIILWLDKLAEGMKNNETNFPELEEDSPELNKMIGYNCALDDFKKAYRT